MTNHRLKQIHERILKGEKMPPLPKRMELPGGIVIEEREDGSTEVTRFPKTDEQWRAAVVRAGLSPSDVPDDDLSPIQRNIFDDIRKATGTVVLWGRAGRGKTMLALRALKGKFISRESVMLMRYPEFRTSFLVRPMELSGMTDKLLAEIYARPKYLLLDELGSGNPELRSVSKTESECLMNVLSLREARGLGVTITTNLEIAQIGELYGEPILSRLTRYGSVIRNFNSDDMPDYREKIGLTR